MKTKLITGGSRGIGLAIAEKTNDKKLIVNNWFLESIDERKPPSPAPNPAAIPQVEKNNTFASGNNSLFTIFGNAASDVGI